MVVAFRSVAARCLLLPFPQSLTSNHLLSQIENIKLVALLGSKPGLEKVAADCPGLEIFVGAVDDEVSLLFLLFSCSLFFQHLVLTFAAYLNSSPNKA